MAQASQEPGSDSQLPPGALQEGAEAARTEASVLAAEDARAQGVDPVDDPGDDARVEHPDPDEPHPEHDPLQGEPTP